jgi:hypothetical protein
MKIVTGLFHSHHEARQALSTLDRHRFSGNEGVTLIDPSKVIPHDSVDEQAASALDVNLIRLGISAQIASSYAQSLEQGSKLIIIKAEDERALEALSLLYEAGAAESDCRALTRRSE